MARKPTRLDVVITPQAQRDINRIWDYNCDQYGPDHADDYIDFLDKETAKLQIEYLKGKIATSYPEIRYQLPDILKANLDVVFCGINPALSAAQSGHHFSNPTNRFWRVLHLAGFTPHLIQPENDRTILEFACGLTAAVQRPTAQASEVTKLEFRQGARTLETTIERYHPRYLAFLGKPAFAALFDRRTVEWGQQSVTFAGAKVWVLPNPSGLNRSFSLASLVAAYRELQIQQGTSTGCID